MQIDQDRVNKFADATGDHQWIHVDVERATREIGGPIAHGYLTLSLIPFLRAGMLPVKGVTRGINYGSDKVRFINMVRVGKRVRLRQKLIGVEPKSGGMQLKNECTIEIEGEERPACVAETISIVYGGLDPLWPVNWLRGRSEVRRGSPVMRLDRRRRSGPRPYRRSLGLFTRAARRLWRRPLHGHLFRRDGPGGSPQPADHHPL